MESLNNFIFGRNNNNTNAPNRNLHPSMRGGLPRILDMLRIHPSFTYERPDLENGNKVLLPSRLLGQITDEYHGNLPYPMVFSISTLRSMKTVYVGVLEFVAPDDAIVVPFWLFNQLKMNDGEMVRVGIVDFLPKANFAKLRPHKTEFIDLPDPKAVLEFQLRNFVCLSKNETISLNFMGKSYLLDILELKPENQYNAGIIIDTDLSIDFAPPLDYVEPKKQFKKNEEPEKPEDSSNKKKFDKFGGKGLRMDGRDIKKEQLENQIKEEIFDPRKHAIPHGIRKEWYEEKFKGKATRIG
jgi:ubiquitin fusion degradation protein 1